MQKTQELIDRIIVLKSEEHGEKNKLLTVFGLKKGIFKTLARGIKAPKAKLKFLSLPFVFCEAEFLNSGKVPVIKTAALIESFSGLSLNLEKFESACMCVQAVICASRKEESDAMLFKLLLQTLNVIENENQPWCHAFLFVLNVLAIAGYKVSPNICSACGSENFSPVFLNYETGELTCKECANSNCVQVKAETINSLKNIENQQFTTLSDNIIKNLKKFFNKIFIIIFEKGLNFID